MRIAMLLVVLGTLCGACGDDGPGDGPASEAEVLDAFAAEGFELFPSQLDGRKELLPLEGEPFVVTLLATERAAANAAAMLDEFAPESPGRFHDSRRNVLVVSDAGLLPEQRGRVVAALARLGAEPTGSDVPEASGRRSLRPKHAARSARLESVGDTLLPARPTVYCWDDDGWEALSVVVASAPGDDGGRDFEGLASPGELLVDLSPWACGVLEPLNGDATDAGDDDLAFALGLFAHELHHLGEAGTDERLAECLAAQTVNETAVAFGLSPELGRRLKNVLWREYPDLPDEYWSPECRAGGAYDREPDTPAFP